MQAEADGKTGARMMQDWESRNLRGQITNWRAPFKRQVIANFRFQKHLQTIYD